MIGRAQSTPQLTAVPREKASRDRKLCGPEHCGLRLGRAGLPAPARTSHLGMWPALGSLEQTQCGEEPGSGLSGLSSPDLEPRAGAGLGAAGLCPRHLLCILKLWALARPSHPRQFSFHALVTAARVPPWKCDLPVHPWHPDP